MIQINRLLLLMPILSLSLLSGCAGMNSKQQVLAAGSQVEVRSYQTRSYDSQDRIRVMRAVIATLQDLRFVIDKADDTVGIVSATKLDGYALSISVSVRPNGDQMVVRANAQANMRAIEDAGPYQDFFAALDKGLFLDDNFIEPRLVEGQQPDRLVADGSNARTNTPAATGPYAYYGEAEAEVIEGVQDSDLWARALVEVEGDEQKRKARYIELRADQLYRQSPEALAGGQSSVPRSSGRIVRSGQLTAAMSDAAKSLSGSVPGLSGTYLSEITSENHFVFDNPKHRRLLLVFDQQGDEIVATSSSVNLKVSGTRDGDQITFFTWPSDISAGEIKGKWQIVDGGSRLEGTWTHPHGGGQWNLTRLQ